jgi:hypothetical protein
MAERAMMPGMIVPAASAVADVRMPRRVNMPVPPLCAHDTAHYGGVLPKVTPTL